MIWGLVKEMVPTAGAGGGGIRDRGSWGGSRSHRYPQCDLEANKPWSRVSERLVTILFAGCSMPHSGTRPNVGRFYYAI